jgi:DNA-binding MltR family transcriptional regulator
MASRSRGKRSRASFDLQRLINEVRDATESWHIIQMWHTQPGDDRSQAIVAGALLEQSLEYALLSHFVLTEAEMRELFADQVEGGISSFAAKIKLAFALGIVEKTMRKELTLIKNIRNVFAHTRASVTFDDREIIAACDDLKLPKTVGNLPGLETINAKDKYAISIKLLYLYLAHDKKPKEERRLMYELSDLYCNLFLGRPSHKQMLKVFLDSKTEPGSSQEK